MRKYHIFAFWVLIASTLSQSVQAQTGHVPSQMTPAQKAEFADLQELIQSSSGVDLGRYQARQNQLIDEANGVATRGGVFDQTLLDNFQEKINSGCLSCPFFSKFDEIKNKWSVELYHLIAPEIIFVFKSICILYIMLMGVLIVIKPSQAMDLGLKLMIGGVLISVVLIMLQSNTGTPYPWLIISVIESAGLKLGALVIGHTIDAQIPLDAGGSLYSVLTKNVETSIFKVVDVAITLMTGGSGSVFGVSETAIRIITGVIIMLPYLFVLGVFMAFLVEAMFKFVSISMISPLLLPAIIFEWSRPYPKAAMRVLLGAFLTIVFASMAMSLTVAVVDAQMADITSFTNQKITAKNAAVQQAVAVCQNPRNVDAGAYKSWSFEGAAVLKNMVGMDMNAAERQELRDYLRCKEAWKPVEQIENEGFNVLSGKYFMIVVIGFVSILLHLGAKTLASNISGAQDGAGAAAAVVGGAKVAVGGGLYASSKMASNGSKAAAGGIVGAGKKAVDYISKSNPLRRGPLK